MKQLIFMVIAFALTLFAQPAHAQQANKVYRIGYLQGSPNMDSRNVRAFRRGLRELGYVEGRNITIEWRHTNRRRDIFAGKVKELVRLGLDCIVTVGVAATRAAMENTNTIPIVMADADGDPVRYGLIASYARPGGNVTGIVSFASQLSGKRLELLKETVPRLSRVAALVKARAEGAAAHIPQIAKAARALGVAFHPLEIQVDEDINKAFRAAAKWKAEALLVVTAGGMRGHRKGIIDLAAQMRLPVMYTGTWWVGLAIDGVLCGRNTQLTESRIAGLLCLFRSAFPLPAFMKAALG